MKDFQERLNSWCYSLVPNTQKENHSSIYTKSSGSDDKGTHFLLYFLVAASQNVFEKSLCGSQSLVPMLNQVQINGHGPGPPDFDADMVVS